MPSRRPIEASDIGDESDVVEQRVEKAVDEAALTGAASHGARRRTTVRSGHVLVVEDDVAVRTLVERALLSRGYEVSAAACAEQALDTVAIARPGLIILDVMMPGMDGFSFVERLRGRPRTAGLPVVFLTARDDPRSISIATGLGARSYVTKPFSLRDLLAQVERVLHSEAP
jgi:DNA-binding response OmpR family regulator